MKNGLKRIACAALAAMLIAACALAAADGYYSSNHGGGYFNYAQQMEYRPWGYNDVEAYEGARTVRVISKSASIWQEPRTNSKKLGSVSNGDDVEIIRGDYGMPLTQNGFYRVSHNGKAGWINMAYAVYAPLEIVLMESNVPAYCAPDTSSKKVGSLSKLTRYTVMGTFGDYYVVNLRQASAFIPMDVAHYDTTFESRYLPAENGVKGYITEATKLRTGPGEWYASVEDVKPGYEFTCVDEINGWYLIAYKSKSTDGTVLVYVPCEDAYVEGIYSEANG